MVDVDGLIHQVSIDARFEEESPPDEEQSLTIGFQFEKFDETSVEEPGWVADVRADPDHVDSTDE